MPKLVSGFTLLEVLIVLVIIAVLVMIILGTFIEFRKSQAIEKDTELVVQVLNQARNQTLYSKNSSAYGVHFSTNEITLFTGSTFSAGAIDNDNYILASTETSLTTTLTGGGSDVVFKRLSGETEQDGTVVVSSSGITKTKTVTIYKTGLVKSQ